VEKRRDDEKRGEDERRGEKIYNDVNTMTLIPKFKLR
jgi:hypothetical protein